MINARLAASAIRGLPVATGVYPNPVDQHERAGEGRSPRRAAGTSSASATACTTSRPTTHAAPAALSAPSASAGLDNIDQAFAFSNTLALCRARPCNETRAQFAYGTLKAPPTDPIGPAVSIAGRGRLRHALRAARPAAREQAVPRSSTTCRIRPGRTRCALGVDFLYNDDTITYPRSIRGSYTFSSLANFLAGIYNNAGFTQTFGVTEVSQTNPNLGIYAQDEWKVAPRPDAERRRPLRPAVPRDDRHGREQCRRRESGFAWSPSPSRQHGRARQCGPLLRSRPAARGRQRAALGRQHDRPRAACGR